MRRVCDRRRADLRLSFIFVVPATACIVNAARVRPSSGACAPFARPPQRHHRPMSTVSTFNRRCRDLLTPTRVTSLDIACGALEKMFDLSFKRAPFAPPPQRYYRTMPTLAAFNRRYLDL